MMQIGSRLFTSRNGLKLSNGACIARYSRRSDSNPADVYKIVKSGRTTEDLDGGYLGPVPNWELLTPRGYRFYLPGGLGPAWYDSSSTALPCQTNAAGSRFDLTVLRCPILLRKDLEELFPSVDLSNSDLSVVTLTLRQPRCMSSAADKEAERERAAKSFVVTAQEVCTKLKLAGYWADFVNPFSGRPYGDAGSGGSLYRADARFRCLGFRVVGTSSGCSIVSATRSKQAPLTGSLFTTAPANSDLLNEILGQFD